MKVFRFSFYERSIYIKKKETGFCRIMKLLHYVDDDIYWKNGWYSNPNDKRLIVQDWACSFNYTNEYGASGRENFVCGRDSHYDSMSSVVCVLMFRIDLLR